MAVLVEVSSINTSLAGSNTLRRQEIKLQVSLITPLYHVKGAAAPETKAAAERARLLMERAEALGEPPEDPLLLFSVLYGFWVVNLVAFKGPVVCDLAAQFLDACSKADRDSPGHGWSPAYGCILDAHGKLCRSAHAFRSRNRTL